jgi:signal peptidase II
MPDSLRFIVLRLGVGIVLVLLLFIAIRHRWTGLALAGVTLVLAGGSSNLVDRVVRGTVIDFVSIGVAGLRTGIFNIADFAIMIGGLLIVIGGVERKETEQPSV